METLQEFETRLRQEIQSPFSAWEEAFVKLAEDFSTHVDFLNALEKMFIINVDAIYENYGETKYDYEDGTDGDIFDMDQYFCDYFCGYLDNNLSELRGDFRIS